MSGRAQLGQTKAPDHHNTEHSKYHEEVWKEHDLRENSPGPSIDIRDYPRIHTERVFLPIRVVHQPNSVVKSPEQPLLAQVECVKYCKKHRRKAAQESILRPRVLGSREANQSSRERDRPAF